MHIDRIKPGDVLVDVGESGPFYVYVRRVNRVTVDVQTEHGALGRFDAMYFDRKVKEHPHFFYEPSWGGCRQCRICGTPFAAAQTGDFCPGRVDFIPLNGTEQMEG